MTRLANRFGHINQIRRDRPLKGMWTIPPERKPIEGVKHSHRGSKMRPEHLVPLST